MNSLVQPVEPTALDRYSHSLPTFTQVSSSRLSVYDLTVHLYHTPAGVVGAFDYNTNLFEPDTVGRMAADYRGLPKAFAAGGSGVRSQT
jgi:hypothetical protein